MQQELFGIKMKRNIRLSKVSEENNQIFFLHEVIRKNFAKISNRISFLPSRYNLSSFQIGLMLLSWYQQGIRDRCLPSIKVYVTINPSRISLHCENCREDYKRLLSWDTLETQLRRSNYPISHVYLMLFLTMAMIKSKKVKRFKRLKKT